MNWTSGPWNLDKYASYDKEIGIENRLALVDYDDVAQDEAIANAHLIAAAPELYEALSGLVGLGALFSDGSEVTESALKNASAALAKARGE